MEDPYAERQHRANEHYPFPVVVDTESPWAHGILRFVDEALEGRSYLLGDEFTAADIMMGFSIFMAQRLELLADYANIRSWLARLQERPALHRALSWRHGDHPVPHSNGGRAVKRAAVFFLLGFLVGEFDPVG